MYAAKGYGGYYDAQPSIYRYVNWSLFSCHSKFYHLPQNLGLFKNVAAQFIGRQGLMNQATTKMGSFPLSLTHPFASSTIFLVWQS